MAAPCENRAGAGAGAGAGAATVKTSICFATFLYQPLHLT